MIYRFIVSTCVGLGLVFGLNLQGITAAFILGAMVLLVDYACLRMRLRLLQKTGTSLKLAAVISGFFFRIINLAVFLAIGFWWLSPAPLVIFQGIIITVPIWNLLAAATYRIKHNNNSE